MALTQQSDFDQSLVDLFVDNSVYPEFHGREIKSRRVLEIGNGYYWKIRPMPRDMVPSTFWDWIERENLQEYNSILINIYMGKKDNIGWHCDQICNLVDPTVVSYSFCINEADKNRVLAIMEFKEQDEPVASSVKHELRHGTRIEFDAMEDKKNNIQHRVSKTLCPRLNITLRKIS